jgi:hypothetical protein
MISLVILISLTINSDMLRISCIISIVSNIELKKENRPIQIIGANLSLGFKKLTVMLISIEQDGTWRHVIDR